MFKPGDLVRCINDSPGLCQKRGRRKIIEKGELYKVLDCRLCEFTNGLHVAKYFVFIETPAIGISSKTGRPIVSQYTADRFELVHTEPEDDLYV